MVSFCKKVTVYPLFLFGLISLVRGDYPCFCNYDVEIKVYTAMDVGSAPLGYMYEFDCKEILNNVGVTGQWIAVAFEHKIGYVQKGPRFDSQVCQGDPSPDDLVTTTTTAGATTAQHTSHVFTTEAPTTSTPAPTTPTPAPTTPTPAPTTATPTTTPAPTTVKPTTTPAPTTTSTSTTTTTPTTTTPTTTTTVPTTTATSSTPSSAPFTTGFQTGNTQLCPALIQQHAISGPSVLGQFGHKCYEFVDRYDYWLDSENYCTRNGGHLVQIGSQREQDYIMKIMHSHFNHPVWIGLHDRNHEEVFEWTSGDAVAFTNWTPGRKLTFSHEYEDCVYMDPRQSHFNGGWDDTDCSDSMLSLFGERHRFACQYDITGYTMPPSTTLDPNASTQQPTGDGNINLCPARVLMYSAHSNLGQYGQYCYEVIPVKHTWDNSENLCQRHGGHLVTISDSSEQQFVSGFLGRHSPTHAVWIGLNDVNSEGAFKWTSGRPVQYTNWMPGHLDNFQTHYSEDCVAFVPYKNNIWDDVPCGYDGFFDESGEVHYPLCQYNIASSVVIG